MRLNTVLGILAGASALWFTPAQAADEIVVGFATAASGFMQAYDKPAQDAALIRIDEINKAGGLLGKKIKPVFADTKTDQAEGAKAGLAVLDQAPTSSSSPATTISARPPRYRRKRRARFPSSSARSRSRPAFPASAPSRSQPRCSRPYKARPWRSGPTTRRTRATSTGCSIAGPSITRNLRRLRLADAASEGSEARRQRYFQER